LKDGCDTAFPAIPVCIWDHRPNKYTIGLMQRVEASLSPFH